MKKKLTLLIFLFPVLLMAQTTYKNGVISFDWGHKKQQNQDSVQRRQGTNDTLKQTSHPEKQAKQTVEKQEEGPYDWRKDGIFKALVHAGINACQVDADVDDGFNYPGFEGGVGVMVRFHRNFSASMEINYSMKGARQNFDSATAANQQSNYLTLQKWRLRLDYIEIPFGINVYDKRQIIMASAGLSIAALVYYYEQNQDGQNITNSSNGPGSPHKYDFCAFGGIHFIIAKHYVIGGQFSYSLVPVRGLSLAGISPYTTGQFNSALTVDFMYIFDPVKKKKGG